MKRRLLYTLVLVFAGLQTFAQTYTYDNLNRLTKVVYSNGTTITYSFDALGNRTSKKVKGATSETYTITTSVTPEGSGTVMGSGTYAKGATIELNANANEGYVFLKWNDGVTDNPRTITVTRNMNFTAEFMKESDTGIDSPDVTFGKNTNGPIYNLQGQRIATPTKGIYIINGVKVVVK